MAYGIQVVRADGTAIVNQTMPGGRLFVDKVVRNKETPGTVTTYTFPDVSSGTYLKVVSVGPGSHTWTTGTSGGSATLTLTATNSPPLRSATTVLFVFTTQTVEPDFGIMTVNDAGERTISSIFPCPEFLGKVTFSPTPTSSTDMAENGFVMYNHVSTSSLGAGRNRMILWSLPDNTNDCWFTTSNSFIDSSFTGTYNLTASFITTPGTGYTVGVAYIFALDGLTTGANPYGLRVYDQAGAVTFDSSYKLMVIKGIDNELDYPDVSDVINTYTGLSFMAGATPAFLVPLFKKEVWTITGFTSHGSLYSGALRKNGSTLYSRLIKTDTDSDDVNLFTGTFLFGDNTDIVQVAVTAADY